MSRTAPAYVCYNDLTGVIGAQFLVQGLDDAGTGSANMDLFALIAGQASDAVDSRLGQRYAVPFTDPFPAIVTQAALIFTAEAIYARRVAVEQNPWTGQANAMRSKLDRIGRGEEPLTPVLQREDPSASVVTERSKTFSGRRCPV